MTAFIGVDVGTGSARAGVFDGSGRLLASHKQDIKMWREAGDIAEQSSVDIWQAVCRAVRAAMEEAGTTPREVRGMGFDAACSMVVLDREMSPLSVSASGDPARNVIVWMDHRATAQAARINAAGHAVLDYVGGRISPEMQTPKMLWLKEHQPEQFAQAGQFFDLPDFLTWAATGSLTRSACTVTCKWTYLAHEARWDDSYFQQIGLPELFDESYARIGQEIVAPGTALAQGLTQSAAQELGLLPGTPVGAALIDAHAGGIGTVGADPETGPEATMAYVFGTSACTMATCRGAHKVPGVWGPYYSAMIPGMWLSEGGQSAAGEAIAHLVSTHAFSAEAMRDAKADGLSLQAYLLRALERCAPGPEAAVRLAGSRVVVPDLLGNRAPFADPGATGIASGLTLTQDLHDLVATYAAAVFGVGYGLRQILAVQAEHGVAPEAVVVSGGAGESATVKQLLADASGYPILSTSSPEPVLLGAAMLGTVASGAYPGIPEAMGGMSCLQDQMLPSEGVTRELHLARYRAFCTFQEGERQLRAVLS
ncbi:MAG: FGGY-family carbohydrate kinase [Pseudomonadota bacterium]